MGLCINWTARAPASMSVATVMSRVSAWREACLDLPFDHVTDVVELSADEITRRLTDGADLLRWFLVQASVTMPIDPKNQEEGYVSVDPVAVVGFTALAGDDCEPMNCFLARYPDEAVIGRHRVLAAIDGWCGRSFSKTQYASTVAAEHFLKCHLTITAALDAAKSLGLLESVYDEGGYWDDRDAEKLLTTVGRWNAAMAGFVGGLELAMGETLTAPIKRHPAFERLEHEGRDTAAIAKAIARALKNARPRK